MNETKPIQKDDWSKTQNDTLKSLAAKPWLTRKHLIEAIETKIPKVSPTKVLYHAVNHQKLAFTIGMPSKAKAEMRTLLKQGLDSATIRDQIHLNHGILKNTLYYNNLRALLRRGPYTLVYDKTTKKTYLEHREVIADSMVKIEGITKEAARKKLINKEVTHPTTLTVSKNEIENLFTTNSKVRGKLRDINTITVALGLEHGSLISYIAPGDLETKTATVILSKIFKDAGMSADAKKYFG